MKPTSDQERSNGPQPSGWRPRLSVDRIWASLADQFRHPLQRNGYALLFGSGTTSAIGLAYWVLAARLYPTEVLGLNSALLSAMLLLAGMGQLGVNAALMRFIPEIGRHTRRLILVSYVIAVAIAMLASLVFYLGIDRWAPALSFVARGAAWPLVFLATVVGWCLFSLQDNVLTGLRQAVWVPAENTIFSVIKIILLIVFARSFPGFGILFSWVIPAVLLIPAVNLLIFRRLIPEHARNPLPAQPRVAAGSILRFGAGNFIGSLFFVVYNTFLPVIVTNQVGVSATAYFYLPWTVASAIQLIGQSLASSLVVEAALDQSKLKAYVKRILISSFGLLAPIALVLLVGSPYLLRIYGPAYAAEGAILLRLLAVASVPSTLVAVAIGLMRARNRNWQIVISQGGLCALALGLAYALLPRYGINGVGIAWLVAQTAAALYLLATEFWPLWRSQPEATRPSPAGAQLKELP